MHETLMTFARFAAAVLGVVTVGAVIQATKPEILGLSLTVTILASIVLLFRPMQSSWFHYRAVTAGLLLSALTLLPEVESGEVSKPLDLAHKSAALAGPQPVSSARSEGAERRAMSSRAKPVTRSRESNPLKDQTKQTIWIEITKDAVRARLKDSGSAKFRNVSFHAYQKETPMVCGEVNGKNSYGGYSGYQQFIASGEALVFLESDVAAGEFSKAWNEMCRG